MALDPELLKIRVYPIKDDIPVMLIDEATIEPERATKD
jgi:uncharacterized protein YbaR (Trm112 family)